MTNAETLLSLAERVEAATGRDRELDFEILCVIDPRATKTGPLPGDPRYTASLDAVMSLVPKGWGWSMGFGQMPPDEETMHYFAAVRPADQLDFTCCYGFATPALALLSAVLRAHASQSQEPSK